MLILFKLVYVFAFVDEILSVKSEIYATELSFILWAGVDTIQSGLNLFICGWKLKVSRDLKSIRKATQLSIILFTGEGHGPNRKHEQGLVK